MSTTVTEPMAGKWDCTNAEYHADSEWHGHTMLNDFRTDAIKFHRKHVLKCEPSEPLEEHFLLGAAVHVRVFEPHVWDRTIVVVPDRGRRSKADKAWWADFELENTGKLILTEEQVENVESMAQRVMAHPQVASMFALRGHCEFGLRAVDPETGLKLKCKPDFLCNGDLLADIKTTRDDRPRYWTIDAASKGYHRQAAHYIHVVNLAIGVRCRFVHIVVSNSDQNRPAACYHITEKWIKIAAEQNRRTRIKLKRCYETGVWTEDQHRAILPVDLPKYAEYEE